LDYRTEKPPAPPPRRRWRWYVLALALAAVFIRGLFLDVMDVDASQYASISMEMLQNDSWLEVLHRGRDYLDKPPLLFWSAAASYAVFGLSNWAYKLPSLLVALFGVYATYRFARRFYDRDVARHAAWMLASSLGFIVVANDVRTDTLLLGFSAGAVWLLAEYVESRRWAHLLGGFVCAGLAMLAKGPIGLVVPAFAVGTQLVLARNWRMLFRWQWLAGLLVVGVLLAPMCWGLYQQFDLHPEKTVNDRQGVSGLYFYFWEQSFGRITGENIWKNDTSGFYFLHVYLWAFLPWALLLTGALAHRIAALAGARFRLPAGAEAYSFGAFALTFIALSQSKYKLPHYIFITLPWAAVLTAAWLRQGLRGQGARVWWSVQYAVLAGMFAFIALATVYVFPAGAAWWLAGLTLLAGSAWPVLRRPFPADAAALVWRTSVVAVAVGLVLNFHFYPHLLPFQSTSAAMHWARAHGVPTEKIVFFGRHGHALDFYAGRILPELVSVDDARRRARRLGELWVYTTADGRREFEEAGVPHSVEASFSHFQVALLSPQFLNPPTRAAALRPVFLVKIPADR
jgi:4-amino-4-deoxy-L-arabinose transferase-like glycosyltransferase